MKGSLVRPPGKGLLPGSLIKGGKQMPPLPSKIPEGPPTGTRASRQMECCPELASDWRWRPFLTRRFRIV